MCWILPPGPEVPTHSSTHTAFPMEEALADGSYVPLKECRETQKSPGSQAASAVSQGTLMHLMYGDHRVEKVNPLKFFVF